MNCVEVSRPYVGGIDDGAICAGDGNRMEELHEAIEVAEVVSAGVCSTGIGEPGHMSEDIGWGAAGG